MQQTQQKRGLGRGLGSLLPVQIIESKEGDKIPLSPGAITANAPQTVPIEKIVANRQQPRETFAEAPLSELAASIREHGILQPLLVMAGLDGTFELIAGERRLRAAKLAGLKEVPVVLRTANEEKTLELALIENIQREDLNPVEEARGYLALQERFQLSHADIATRVGKSREAVANNMRLLKLPSLIQEDIIEGRISGSHARCLLALPNIQDQMYFRERILEETLSVRDVERMVQEKVVAKKLQPRLKKNLSAQMKMLIGEMENALGTKVRVQFKKNESEGELVVQYYSWQDLDRLYRKITNRT